MQSKLYKDRAVLMDFNEFPSHDIRANLFVDAAIKECWDFLPNDWYIHSYTEDLRTISVRLERHDDMEENAPTWVFNLTADPQDEEDDTWLVFDVMLYEPDRIYGFQLP